MILDGGQPEDEDEWTRKLHPVTDQEGSVYSLLRELRLPGRRSEFKGLDSSDRHLPVRVQLLFLESSGNRIAVVWDFFR